MGMLNGLLRWILRDVKLPISVIQDHMMEMDQDKDGCISIAELADYLKSYYEELEG